MNFSTPNIIPSYQPRFQGGSWKKRLVAKKVARHHERRRIQGKPAAGSENDHEKLKSVSSEQEDGVSLQPRPAKRKRENGAFSSTTSQATVATRSSTAVESRPKQHKPNQPREVISSLFSYNPKPASAPEQHDGKPLDDVPAEPSNAPLVNGADTFASLGLANTLANHLVTKLELKKPTAIQKSAIGQLLKEDSDAFIQSETGSGKTLAYLLPLLQRLLSLRAQSDGVATQEGAPGAVHRDSGLFAIILAPTRELCKQISVVLERLLGCAHWLVAGTVIGGEKKKSEKARLRKGLNILVATPGRLADHLENTEALDVSNVRWLVLDEGDRLMDLGFEEEIQKIIQKLDDGRQESRVWGLPPRRTTVLCSATMKITVQRLGEISLKDAALIKADEVGSSDGIPGPATQAASTFYAPAQLKQAYTTVAAKLRLVALTGLLKRTFARKGSVMKAIVFISCADSVDFHYDVFTRSLTEERENAEEEAVPSAAALPSDLPFAPSPHLSSASTESMLTVYKLHGSLPQATRTSIVRHFATSANPSLLLATDVASRGLDLPNLDLVIEYDPPFSSDDHLHRIGRTARLGRNGRAVIFLLPGREEGYVDVLRSAYHPAATSEGVNVKGNLTHHACNDILRKGFSPATGITSKSDPESNWEARATSFQLEVERWVLSNLRNQELARRAFQSHVRAYATHASTERKYFDIKELHLGHLAKAFGLRDAPGRLNVPGMRSKGEHRGARSRGGGMTGAATGERGEGGPDEHREAHERAGQMRRKMREMAQRASAAGAGEFNIA